MDWATAAAIVADGMPSLSDPPDAPGDDYEFWQRVKALVDSNGNGELSEAYLEDLHPRDRSGKWMEKLGLSHLREVGGAPRDELMGRTPKDIDYVAAETPERIKQAVEQAGGKAEELMVRDRLVGVRATHPDLPPDGVEIVPPRIEQSTGASRHDFTIVPHPGLDGSATPERMLADDAQRRDFTVNALYRDPVTGTLTDPTGRGEQDARNRVLHMVHDTSFQEDPLRMLRGARFVSQHGLEPDAETLAAMRRDSGGMTALTNKGVSGTVQTELGKLLMGDSPGKALRVMRDTGMFQTLLPELAPMVGFDQRSPYHEHVLDEHTFNVIDELARMGASHDARLAALFHDSGKPLTANLKPGTDTFRFHSHPEHGDHADVGADIARSTLNRLNYPADTINHVTGLVRDHMLTAVEKPTPVKARRLRAAHSDRFLTDLLDHKQADMEGHGEAIAKSLEGVHKLRGLLAENATAPRSLKDLNVTGSDLIANGMEPGPRMGAVLRQLLTEVVVDPTLNRHEWLLHRAERLAATPVQEAELEEAKSIYEEVLHPRDRLGRWMLKRGYNVHFEQADKPSATRKSKTITVRGPTPEHQYDALLNAGEGLTGVFPKGPPRPIERAAMVNAARPTRVEQRLRTIDKIATRAHAGQTDKSQRPYIDHVHAVADSVGPEARPVALMHDALEDTHLTERDLEPVLSPDELDAVKLLTRPHSPDYNYDDYIDRIANKTGKAGELAREVKRADLQHNLGRLGNLDAKTQARLRPKYEDALRRLARTPHVFEQEGAPDNLSGLSAEQVEANLRSFYQGSLKSPDHHTDLAWYDIQHALIDKTAKEHGIDPVTWAAMISATSPQLAWDFTTKAGVFKRPNMDLAENALRLARRYPDEPAPKLVDRLLKASEGKKGPSEVGGLGGSVENAIRIYRGEDPDKVLNAPKTRSFYNNLVWPERSTTVTVDAHMARAAMGIVEKKGYARADKAIDVKAKGSGYTWVADIVTKLADEYHVRPHEMQAAIWMERKRQSDAREAAEKAAKKAAKSA
jgi:tRNA nucleotidyltransferase (CCA-adding enzyme)